MAAPLYTGLPAYLSKGYIAVYGIDSSNGITVNRGGYQFGAVTQRWDNDQTGSAYPAINSIVLFPTDKILEITYNDETTLLLKEQDIILVESIAP